MQIRIMESKTSVWAALLVIIFIGHTSAARKLNSSTALSNKWQVERDLENELEQKRSKSSQWSGWSDWSTCSRSCDGGIAQQLRRCHNPNGCKGENARFKICNMQPCPEVQDFRARQCLAYNDVPYDGTLYRWTPHYDYVEPCALTCRGRPAHLPDDETIVGSEDDDGTEEHFDEPSVIVQLSGRVQDGTRCRSGSLDMCIQGKCQRVGCDLKIGSGKKVDACGVCGGDGSSCSQPLYQWEIAPMSLCSVTCGGGYKMSRPSCKNRVTGSEVEDSLCSATTRPEPAVIQCNTHSCPPRWITDEWSPCSRLCGNGYRERAVVCAEESNGIKTRVRDSLCRTPKPLATEQCNLHECPKWETEDWSGCSVSCGSGIQIRGVECKNRDGSLSAQCDPHTRPPTVQECTTGIQCHSEPPFASSLEQEPDEASKSEDEDDADMDRDADADAGEDGEDMDERSDAAAPYNDQPPVYSHQQSSRLHHDVADGPRAERLIGERPQQHQSHQKPSTEPTFIKDNEWSACSVTCGEGIRRRAYKCKIFLEYSRTVATVNDTLCEGAKPQDEVERCVEEPCMLPSHGYDEQYPRDSIKVGVSEPGKTYVWHEQGYTSCSASCLGGVEELIINCIREDNKRVVSPFLCSPETKPEARVRTCNDRPCPPRWNYSDYTPCSKSCGIGIKTREVQCIHEVTRGGENTMVVPNSMCPQPPPADRQYCNVLDCPVQWEAGEWSKCSHTCGYGIKERKVECKQIMAQEHKIERPESMCPSAKPADKRSCNVKPCPPEDPKPIISISNTTHIQHDPKKSKITLKVGGAAVVFFGTQVKIKCPVKRYNRTKIRWTKDHKPLARTRKFKVSKKGALRILDITFRDAGTYSCHAGLSTAEINIEVKAKPGMQPEDYEKHDADRLVRERSGTEPLTSADMTASEGGSSSSNNRKNKNSRERSRRPKTDGIADSSIMEDDSQLVQHSPDGIPQPAASNSASRNILVPKMPHFQALIANLQLLLWPFQKFSSSKGHHLLFEKGLEYGIDMEQLEKDEPAKPQIITNENEDSGASAEITKTSSDDDEGGEPEDGGVSSRHGGEKDVNGDGNYAAPDVTYEWMTTDWSECSQKCGGGGLRTRSAYCLARSANSTTNTTTSEHADNGHCEDSGLQIPDTFESCGNEECPKWSFGAWTNCQQSRCFGRNTAIQRREIICKYKNGTRTDSCDDNEKPIERQECYNERCKGIWRVEPWSECNSSCNKQGIKYRILQCVWYGTRRPAGNACRHQPRPAVMKVCKGPPCSTKGKNCKDSSRYCKNVRSMGLCRLSRYQQKCCKSCRFHIFN